MSASDFKKAVEKLIRREPRWRAATAAPVVGRRPGTVSTGRPASAPGSVGAALTFVEIDYAQREHYTERTAPTSDGIFEVAWRPTKKLYGQGGATIELKEPPAP